MTMFDRWRSPQPSAATDLDSYLDELDLGVLAPRTELDPSIAAVASRIHQAGIRTAEPAGLRSQLWEELMQSAPSMDAGSLAAPIPLDDRRTQDSSAGLGALPRVIQARPRHVLELIAAAAIIVGLIGAALIGQRSGNSTPGSALFAPFSGTPPLPCGETTDEPYADCPHILDQIGFNAIPPAEVLVGEQQQVQLQGWAITAGNAYTGAQEDASGGVVDFVLSGVYSATFTVPVVVHQGGYTDRTIGYIDAGETVELTRGDSVSYQLGGLVEIRNPLSVQRLEFKRAVIYSGDVSAFSATSEGVTNRTEGETTLTLSPDSPKRELQVELWYISKPQGTNLLPPEWAALTVIGPVDPQSAPEGIDGFALVIGAFRG